jgi:uncharacterized phage infection (PIP) family protein YhgE
VRGTIRALGDLIPAQEKSKQGFINTDLLLKSLPIGMGDFTAALREYGKEVLETEEKQEKQRLGLIAADKAFKSAREGVEDLTDEYDAFNDAQEEAIARSTRIEAALDKEATALSKLAAALGEVTQIELEKELNDITKALDEARESTDGNSDAFTRSEEIARQKSESIILRLRGIRDGLGDVGEDAARASLGFNKLGDAIDRTGDALDDTGDSFDSLSVSVRDTNSALSDQALQAKATGRELKHLTALNEQLALAEARTALAATQEERKRITGIGGINRDNSTGKYGLSEFGTGGTLRVNPDGTLRPA